MAQPPSRATGNGYGTALDLDRSPYGHFFIHAPLRARIMTRQAASTHPGSTVAAKPAADIDRLCIDTIRTLAIDAVQKAQSGHAGAPMGFAPVAYTLWQDALRYDPADPLWANRDRFVLSDGHAWMLLYALIHLAGVRRVDGRRITDAPAVSLDDIKNFRQHRQRHARPSGIRPHHRRRDHDRAARPGLRQQRRHGDRIALARRPL